MISKQVDELNKVNFGDVISNEMVDELRQNIDFLRLACPIGEVIPIFTNILGVPTPDPNVWQECNGSEITNENSPMRSMGGTIRRTPDLRNRYVKVPLTFGQSGFIGGENDTLLFRHSHGGNTGLFVAPEDVDHSNNQREAAFAHSHTIPYSFDFLINIEPPYYTIKWFMRIQ